jgi:hypothetical protein
MDSLASVRLFVAPLQKEDGLLLMWRAFGQKPNRHFSALLIMRPLRSRALLPGRGLCDVACLSSHSQQQPKLEARQRLSQGREKCQSIDPSVARSPTRKEKEKRQHLSQWPKLTENHRRNLENVAAGVPTQESVGSARQWPTPGTFCMSEYSTQGKWTRTKIANLPGFANGCRRFKQSYPLYIPAGGG